MSLNKNGYVRLPLKGRHYLAHRIIWFYVFGVWPNQIDHINGIRSDNRIDNLRDVKSVDNNKNRKLPKNNKSGVIGVFWVGRDNRWSAQISESGKKICLGYFKDKESAIEARLKAEVDLDYHSNHGRNA